jgi:hypothetical protein
MEMENLSPLKKHILGNGTKINLRDVVLLLH